jgi:tripartite-type tricarboxylate transporter receptor subunit TctC
MKEEVLDKFNADEAWDQYVQMTGAVPTIVVPQDQVDAIRQQRAEMQQAMMEAELNKSQADTANSAAGAARQVSDAQRG